MNIDKPQCNLKTCRYCHDHNCFGQYETCEYTLAKNDRPHGEWIPCSERLPEENKTVIASTKYGVFPEARYTKEDGWEWAYESGADYWEELEDVTAWMPLPEPYREER